MADDLKNQIEEARKQQEKNTVAEPENTKKTPANVAAQQNTGVTRFSDEVNRDKAIGEGPIEGSVRENAVLKNTDVAAGTAKPDFVPDSGPLEGRPTNTVEKQRQLADQAAREGRENLTQMTGGRVTEGNKAVAKSILGENVVEDKASESIKADLSSTIASPGLPPAGSLDPSRTIQREDGTLTTADRPEETAHYLHGSRVMVKQDQMDKFKALTEEMNNLQDGRGIGDIPVSDLYWEKKKELDAYVARLRR